MEYVDLGYLTQHTFFSVLFISLQISIFFGTKYNSIV